MIYYGITTVYLGFNLAVDPSTVDLLDAVVQTPSGAVLSNLTVSASSFNTVRLDFPAQTANGDYTVMLGPQINDLFGNPMSQVYTGAFTVSLPVIQGVVTNLSGDPVAGVALNADGMSPATTDANGNYSLGFMPNFTFTVTPSLDGFVSVPGSRSYGNLTESISNQNYLVVSEIAPTVTGGLSNTNLLVNWLGIPGVTYQLYYSTNLTDWFPYGSPMIGSNAVVEIPLPVEGEPEKFFKVQANN